MSIETTRCVSAMVKYLFENNSVADCQKCLVAAVATGQVSKLSANTISEEYHLELNWKV